MLMPTSRFAALVASLSLVCAGCSRPASPSPASQSQPVRPETPAANGHLDVHVDRQSGINVDIQRRSSASADAPK
jgi:hypothetical protein